MVIFGCWEHDSNQGILRSYGYSPSRTGPGHRPILGILDDFGGVEFIDPKNLISKKQFRDLGLKVHV